MPWTPESVVSMAWCRPPLSHIWLERSRAVPAVALSIVDSDSLSGLRAVSRVGPRSAGVVDVDGVVLVSRSFWTSWRTLLLSSM